MLSERTKQQDAAIRLGAQLSCEWCGKFGTPYGAALVRRTEGGNVSNIVCCSATCAVALLDVCFQGVARSLNKKRNRVIALKTRGRKTGIWPHGRRAIEREKISGTT
jgi:hypothetical protein